MRNKNCPLCGGALQDIGKAVKCERNEKGGGGCTFILWKNSMGHDFTAEEFDDLIDGKRIIIDCIGKDSGKPYKREIYLNNKFEIQYDRPFEPNSGGFV